MILKKSLKAVSFYVGAVLYKKEGLKMDGMFIALFSIMFAAFSAGNAV